MDPSHIRRSGRPGSSGGDDVDNLERYSKEFAWRNGVMANRFGVKGSYGETPKRFGELWRNSETFWRVMAKRFGVKGSYGESKNHVPLRS